MPQCRNAALPLLFLLATALHASDAFSSSGYSSGAAAYLDLPAHAHSAGLGKSVTAWRSNLAGVQYNPAILDAATGIHLVGSYSFVKDDRRLIAIQGAMPIGKYVVVGAAFRNAGVDDIEQRDEYGEQDGFFDDRENAIEISVGGRFLWNISAAIRARYLNQLFKGLLGTDDGRANGMGFDLGATWAPVEQICVGVSGLNIGSYMWWATGHRDVVLPQARVGVCGMFLEGSLTAEVDVARTLRQPMDVGVGVQYTLFDILSARLGATTSIDVKDRHSRNPDISTGVGVRYSFFGCDYALTIPTDNARDMLAHKISLVLRFSLGELL